MNNEAQRDYAFWDSAEDGQDTTHLDCMEVVHSVAHRPIKTYSRRSSFINQIRTHSKRTAGHADDDLVPPTLEAQTSAIAVINNLPEGCLDLHLAVAHCGEINLFFGNQQSPFQLLIDEDGLLSYFGIFGKERLAGSDCRVDEFPYMKLLHLLGSL